MMTSKELDAIQARADAATPGTWNAGGDNMARSINGNDPVKPVAWLTVWNDRPNADFIAHAREDVPALVAEVRRLREAAKTP